MKLRTPVTGVVVDVEEAKAEIYLRQGFQPVEPQKDKPKPAAKKKAAKKEA